MAKTYKIKEREKENRSILIGRCDYEIRVKYAFHWAQEVIEEAEDMGFEVLDLKGPNFVEDKFNKIMTTRNPFFVFLNGHGHKPTGYAIYGHNEEIVITTNKNDYLLKDKIAYFLSCYTAKCLGLMLFDKGCSYIGYDDEFLFMHQKLEEPLGDMIAKPFKEASNEVALTILNGGTPKEAYENSQKIFDKWINYWGQRLLKIKETEVPLKIVEEIMGALLNDKECQRCFSIEQSLS